MDPLNDIKEDIEELKNLKNIAKRQNIKIFLNKELETLQKKLINSTVKKPEEKKDSAAEAAKNKIYTVSLRNYSWDQSDKFLKLYVTLSGVQGLANGSISLVCTQRGLVLSVKDLEGKNYSLTINNLAYDVIADQSYHKVKTDMIVLYIAKTVQKSWEAVTQQEVKTKKAEESKFKAKQDTDDPSAGLMDMMKEMYNNGDDEMKRMLNKSWYESQKKGNKLPMDL